jgi:hypothetical protein
MVLKKKKTALPLLKAGKWRIFFSLRFFWEMLVSFIEAPNRKNTN